GWQRACERVRPAGRRDARETGGLGLATRVAAHDDLMKTARQWADEIASNPPLAIAAAKRVMRYGLDSTFEANANQMMAELRHLMRTKDFEEGDPSFIDKPEPNFERRSAEQPRR